MSNEPRYTAVGVSVVDSHDHTVLVEYATDARALCDLLNAGDQARALAAAVAGLGEFGVHHDAYSNEWVAVTYHEGTRRLRRGDTPAAAIVALWRAVQATGEGEEG